MRREHLFTAVWLAFCVFLLEAGLQVHYRLSVGQWLFQRTAVPLYEADALTGFRVRPNLSVRHRTPEFRTTIFTDSHGFRTAPDAPPIRPTPDPQTLRILLLGPSFAFGWGVDHEDSLGEIVARRLQSLGDGRVETINAGVPAMGPRKQLSWFRENGSAWQPDIVVQVVYGSLQVPLDYGDDFRVTPAGYLLPAQSTSRQRITANLKKSALVFRVWSLVLAQRPQDGVDVQGAGRRMDGLPQFDPQSDEARDAVAFYKELQEVVHGAGAELLVAYAPLSYRVHPEDIPRWEHLGAPEPETARQFDRELGAHLRDRGIPLLDLEPDLQRAAADGEERLYYRVDIHWTPAGNRIAGAAVAAHLAASRPGAATAP